MSMPQETIQTWDLWFPQAAASGLSFARSQVDPQTVVLVHSAPPVLTVEVRDSQGNVIALGKDLQRTQESPICRLTVNGREITREDIWPQESDLETIVILPGGEAGSLKAWWNAPDHSEWRWTVELYNKR
jgi:hypothetical protein